VEEGFSEIDDSSQDYHVFLANHHSFCDTKSVLGRYHLKDARVFCFGLLQSCRQDLAITQVAANAESACCVE
jgi:hypothetical protein